MSTTQTPWGPQATLFTLTNDKGWIARICTYGATLAELQVPDRSGKLASVVLGYDSLEGYLTDRTCMGAIVGRYANRIAKGQFTLEGREYALFLNHGAHTLHGGKAGFHKHYWAGKSIERPEGPAVELTYISPDLEENFPGRLETKAVYLLTNTGELRIEITATTDKTTVVNLANHAYWNLAGAGAGKVLDHEMQISASTFTVTDAESIPSGEIKSVNGTPLDFRKPTPIGTRIDQTRGGYDDNFVIDGTGLRPAARVRDPKTGRVMTVFTNQPGIQFYSANHLEVAQAVNGPYHSREAFCLETQHFPDSPNHSNFPTTVLKPGETFRHTTVHAFATE